MKTIITIVVFFLLFTLVSRLIGVFVLNIVGFPGAIIGRNSIDKKEPKYILGVIISAIPQVYIYLSYMVYVINWTESRVDSEGFTKYIVWFFCFASCIGTIQQIRYNANNEFRKNPTGYQNPQLTALIITEIVSVFFFFLFVFYPASISPLWSWVLNIDFPI
jgi:hypothetical protein